MPKAKISGAQLGLYEGLVRGRLTFLSVTKSTYNEVWLVRCECGKTGCRSPTSMLYDGYDWCSTDCRRNWAQLCKRAATKKHAALIPLGEYQANQERIQMRHNESKMRNSANAAAAASYYDANKNAIIAEARETVARRLAGEQKPRKLTTKHGMSGTPEYKIWTGMLQRCHNKRSPAYPRYGGRGIFVCKKWHTFADFFADVGHRPSTAHSIDRINNDGPYAPDNVQWATRKEQLNNKSTNLRATHDGQTLTFRQWADLTGIAYDVLYSRYKAGWPMHKVLAAKSNIM